MITFATLLLAAVGREDLSKSLPELAVSAMQEMAAKTEHGKRRAETKDAKKFAVWAGKVPEEEKTWTEKKMQETWEKEDAWARKTMSTSKSEFWAEKNIKEAWEKKRAWQMPEKEVWEKGKAWARKGMPGTEDLEKTRGWPDQQVMDESISEIKALAEKKLPGLQKAWQKTFAEMKQQTVEGMLGKEHDLEETGSWAIAATPEKQALKVSNDRKNKVNAKHDSNSHRSHGHKHEHREPQANGDGREYAYDGYGVAGGEAEEAYGQYDEYGYGYGRDDESKDKHSPHRHGHSHHQEHLHGKHNQQVGSLAARMTGIKGFSMPLSTVIGFLVLALSCLACMLFKGIDKCCAKRRSVRMVTADGVLMSTASPALLDETDRTERGEGQVAASSTSA